MRGDRNKNVRPHVRLGRWRYTNPKLASAYDLINRDVVVYCDRRDVQVAHATVLDTGEQLGALEAPFNKRGLHMSWRNRALMNDSGLSQRLHQNATSVPAQWCEEQENLLRERSKSARNKKRASKEALALSKVQADQRRLEEKVSGEPVPVPTSPSIQPRKSSFFDFEVPLSGPAYLGD